MKKRLCAFFTAAVLAAQATAAFAALDRVYFTNLTKTATGVSVDARYEGSGEESVYLIGAYIDADGKIVAIDEEHTTLTDGGSDTLTLTVEDKSDVASLSYFLWDGINGRTPIDNAPPAPATNISSTAQRPGSVTLEWDAALDDFDDVSSYDVYNMGMKVGTATTEAFTDTNYLDRGAKQTYELVTTDGEGLQSPRSAAFSVKTGDIPTAVCAGSSVITDGRLEYIVDENYSYYGSTAAAEADGISCRRTVNPKEDGLGTRDIITRHPFKIGADYAQTLSGITDFTLSLTYFDDFSGNIVIEYVKSGGDVNQFQASSSIKATNTGKWRTASVRIYNADFSRLSESSGNSYAVMRFNNGKKDFKVRSLSVAPTGEYTALLQSAKFEVTEGFVNGGILAGISADGAVQKATIGSRGAAKIPAGTVLECDASADIIKSTDTSLCVEIEYYTEDKDESIVLKYNSSSGNEQEETEQPVTAAGKWQRMRFELTDAAFNNAYLGSQLTDGADFTVSARENDVYIHSVRVFKK